MTIETKHNVGATVWAMINNRPKEFKIKAIDISVNASGEIDIEYCLSNYGSDYLSSLVDEAFCKETKEALLQSL